MKLRKAKKILKNWRDGNDYPESTLTAASKRYRPYLVRSCREFNEKHSYEGIVEIPYIIRNITEF